MILWNCDVNSFSFKNVCSLTRHKCETPWWWHGNVETCSSIYYIKRHCCDSNCVFVGCNKSSLCNSLMPCVVHKGGRGSSVGVVTRLRAGRSMLRILAGPRGAFPKYSSQWIPWLFPGGKAAGGWRSPLYFSTCVLLLCAFKTRLATALAFMWY